MFQFDSTLNCLRSIGTWEAISSIILFFLAVPLKYIWGEDLLIQPVGMVHGILWFVYVAMAITGQIKYNWGCKLTVLLTIASIVPAGPLIADAKLLRNYKVKV